MEKKGYKLLGEGYNASPGLQAEGFAVNVSEPRHVMVLLKNLEKLQHQIIVSPNGTCTFVSPALTSGTAGVITWAGSPESHLGIVGREFGVPIVMTLNCKEGGNTIPDGTPLLIDCTDNSIGRVYIKVLEGEK